MSTYKKITLSFKLQILPYEDVRTIPTKPHEGQARAKFNFVAQTNLELSLVKGKYKKYINISQQQKFILHINVKRHICCGQYLNNNVGKIYFYLTPYINVTKNFQNQYIINTKTLFF